MYARMRAHAVCCIYVCAWMMARVSSMNGHMGVVFLRGACVSWLHVSVHA